MSKSTSPRLVVSVVLFSAMAMAQTGANNGDSAKNKEHHSRLAKVAFWRHHKEANNGAKQTQPMQAAPTQAKAAQPTPKQAQVRTTQVKPVPAKHTVAKQGQKQGPHASHISKTSVKKTPGANKAKPQQKGQDPKAVSLKQ